MDRRDGQRCRVQARHAAHRQVKGRGFAVETAALDKGYDIRAIYDGCEDRDVRPIIPLEQTPGVKRGAHHTPRGEHGE